MNLLDGLNYYKKNPDEWEFTLEVEGAAKKVLKLISPYGDQPNLSDLAAAHHLLRDIEKWKAMCIPERMIYAEQNSPQSVWNALCGAANAQNDRDAILSIMQLRGFGASRDENGQRTAKVATAVLRFLKPDEWGVVDWRTAAMLGLLKKSNWDVDQAMVLAAKENFRAIYEDIVINENGARAYNQMYRERRATPSFPRAVDVEMAVFGLSLMAWPMP